MRNHSSLVRQWSLLRLLSARRNGVALAEMAQEMGVGEKTIRRDLSVFQETGFPVEETVGRRGRKTWRLKPLRNEPPLCFTYDEAMALYLGRQFLEPLAGTFFWQAAQSAFKKIRAGLGEAALTYLRRMAGRVYQTSVGASDYSEKAELIDRLSVGIEDNKAVFITYQSLQATEPVSYDVHPYGLAHHRGSLYLIGYSPTHKEVRHWKVDRIEAVDLTGVPFNQPEDFDVQEHLSRSFGIYHGTGDVRVKVRFSSTVARYVQESRWHPSQKLNSQPDGGLLAEFRLSGTEEIKRWLLSFGQHAEVLEPSSLRQEMLEELHSLLEAYGAPAPARDKTQPEETGRHLGRRRSESRTPRPR